MNENERQNIAKGLTLQFSETEKPFALEGKEENFGPDDWAWLFLRMNKEYKIAYAQQNRDTEKNQCPIRRLVDLDGQDFKVDHDGSCARRFGLGAWLNPEVKLLPALDYGGSWFFPLKRLVSEGPYRTKASDKPHFRNNRPFSNVGNATPRISADESPFGYRILANVEYPLVCIDVKRNWILASIDCGVPPDGQMSALAALAKISRRHLRDQGRKTNDDRQPCEFVEIRKLGMSPNLKFARSSSAIKKMDGVLDLWRVIALDSLGPLVTQIEAFLTLLKKEHQAFVHQKLAPPPPIPTPFPTDLPTPRRAKGSRNSGGNYLKALLVVAELQEKFNDGEIMEIINTSPSSGSYASLWRHDFHSNIDGEYGKDGEKLSDGKYVIEGKNLIDGGYKWLVHAQKPNRAAPLLPTRNSPRSSNPIGAKERARK